MGHAMADSTVAVRQFQEIFLDDARRQDRAQWRDYFISEIFLDAQYEEDFMSAVHGFLQRQNIVPYTKLPDGLVVELAIVYVLRPGEQDHLAPVEACEEAADIWNCQENREKHYQELMSKASFIRRKSYAEYRTMRRVVLEDTWEYRYSDDDMEEYSSRCPWRAGILSPTMTG